MLYGILRWDELDLTCKMCRELLESKNVRVGRDIWSGFESGNPMKERGKVKQKHKMKEKLKNRENMSWT